MDLRPLSLLTEPEELPPCSFWRDCVFTWKYFFHVVFVSVNQLKIYIFLGTVYVFLGTFNLSEERFDLMRRTLGIVQLTGIIWSPIVGLIVDRNKKGQLSKLLVVPI